MAPTSTDFHRRLRTAEVAQKNARPSAFRVYDVRMYANPSVEHDLFVLQMDTLTSFNDLMRLVINSWLRPGEAALTEATIQDIFSCLKQLFNMMGFRWGKHLILTTVIYVDRFISLTGKTDYPHIFNWILISALVSIKFWGEDEFDVDYNLTSFVSGLALRDIVTLEREFLRGVDYVLYLTKGDLEKWVTKALHTYLPPPPPPPAAAPIVCLDDTVRALDFSNPPNSPLCEQPTSCSSSYSPFVYQALAEITLACE